ncbi:MULTISPECIES: hypothetical protein [unclassified Variovorax]|uniref:hypothetical protein n=1 Tax=unclassified Variovorax TaxID=663243 RepID=UPI003F485EFC
MNVWRGRCLLFFLFMLATGLPMTALAEPAACSAQKTQVASGKQPQFLISAVLRKGSQAMEIKLVHSRQPASNADEATGIFLRRVLQEYFGYSVLSTLTSEIEEAPPACPARGALHAGEDRKPIRIGMGMSLTAEIKTSRRRAIGLPLCLVQKAASESMEEWQFWAYVSVT